jgi:hypothetical protein
MNYICGLPAMPAICWGGSEAVSGDLGDALVMMGEEVGGGKAGDSSVLPVSNRLNRGSDQGPPDQQETAQ